MLYKLINNAVYGKAMENVRNRIDVILVSNEKDYLNWTSKLSFMSQNIFDNVGRREAKVTLRLKKLVYVGINILDLGKILMHEFHYDYIKNKTIIHRQC